MFNLVIVLSLVLLVKVAPVEGLNGGVKLLEGVELVE